VKKVAVALDAGVVSAHFGRTSEFLVVSVEDGREVKRELMSPPGGEHVPGLFPEWIKSIGADTVVAGGMGAQAKSMFRSFGIEVCTVPPMEADAAVKALLAGSLESVDVECDHGHGHTCGK
jgi:predicted Fe-Mo cluster-binding NifX family protein